MQEHRTTLVLRIEKATGLHRVQQHTLKALPLSTAHYTQCDWTPVKNSGRTCKEQWKTTLTGGIVITSDWHSRTLAKQSSCTTELQRTAEHL